MFFIYFELKHGLRSSVLLFVFWGSLLLLSTFKFRSKILQHDIQVHQHFENVIFALFNRLFFKYPNIDYWDFILFYEFYGLLLILLVLTVFSEKKQSDSTDNLKKVCCLNKLLLHRCSHILHTNKTKNPYPEPNASLLSRITFWWINPLIVSGYKKALTRDDMWDIEAKEMCDYLTKKLEHEWNKLADE